MKREFKTVTYKRVLPQLLAELKKHFDNDRYRKSRTYAHILSVTGDEVELERIAAIEPDLRVVIAFAKLRGFTDLEQHCRNIIRLF